MFKIIKNKKVLFFSIVVFLLTIVFLILNSFSDEPSIANQLASSDYEVEVREVTFLGYESQNISAKKENENVFIKVVENVEKESAEQILKRLEEPIENAQKVVTLFDPYVGEERTLSVPEKMRPQKEKLDVGENFIEYYSVYTNEIFSLRIFSETEANYKGLFSVYFCDNESKAYRLEIYYPIEDFNEGKAVDVLSSLFCKR